MDKLKIGSLITEPQVRDAIHVAIAPVVAGTMLHPGQRVGLVADRAQPTAANIIGIVDPFLTHAVPSGATFWLFLFPGSITSLAHHWTHPAFEAQEAAADPSTVHEKTASMEWIRKFAEGNDLTFNKLMQGARSYLRDGDYICEPQLEGEGVPDEFWKHFEIIEGVSVPEYERGSFFTCSC